MKAFSTSTQSRLLTSAMLAACVAMVGWLLLATDWQPAAVIQRASYDALHSFSGSDTQVTGHSPVVIVYLDLNSYAERGLDPSKPWPRELHAELLRRLKSAGAKATVFDIVFSTAGTDPAADLALAQAIRDNGNVILAAEYNDKSSVATDDGQPWAKLGHVGDIYGPFMRVAAGHGIATLGIDDDRAVRRFVAGFTASEQPALSWAAASALRLPVTESTNAMNAANRTWIRYYGPPLTIPHVSYGQAIAPDGVTDDFFRGKIVFVGARPLVGNLNDRQDEFRSPYHSWRHKELFLPGVEVHATEMLNLVREDRLHRLTNGQELIILLLASLGFGGGLIWLRPIHGTIAAVIGAGLAVGLACAGFDRGIWFPWLIVCGAQIPVALGGSVLFHSLEWYRARKRFEASKKIADAKIREQAALIDKAHDAILVQDTTGKITYANRSAERLYGWSLADLRCDDVREALFSPDAVSAKAARSTALRDGEWNGELRQQTRSGRVVIVASRWTLIHDEAGRAHEMLLINSDITEQKDLEQQFLRTQRMNTIGSLAGGMAHDLNNALAPILMGTQLLRRKSTDEESRDLLALMETNTLRGADMVRQVLLFARGRGGEFERLELRTLVADMEKLVRETFPKSITVETFLPDDLWPVNGNTTQLHQVLLNLSVNARDAMTSGGKLTFVADNVKLTTAEAAAIPNGAAGEFVSLAVSDTGEGMTPEVQAKIFEPFFSTKPEGRGTGIGLATVQRIVKAHGGFLRVECETGQGTTFEIFLPRARSAAATAPAESIAESPRGKGELILIADDEQAIRDLMKSELLTFGYRVLTAANGAEAVTLFREHIDDVRLLVTDDAMPMMDGRAMIKELRLLKPALPIIFTSGQASLERIEDVVELSKPFPLEELLMAIHRSLNRTA